MDNPNKNNYNSHLPTYPYHLKNPAVATFQILHPKLGWFIHPSQEVVEDRGIGTSCSHPKRWSSSHARNLPERISVSIPKLSGRSVVGCEVGGLDVPGTQSTTPKKSANFNSWVVWKPKKKFGWQVLVVCLESRWLVTLPASSTWGARPGGPTLQVPNW